MTTDLRTYRKEDLEAIVESIDRELREGVASAFEVDATLKGLGFRDSAGVTWTVSPSSRRSYRWAKGRWEAQPLPAGPFEGPDDLAAWNVRKEGMVAFEELPSGPPPKGDARLQLKERIRQVRGRYERGELSSATAEDSLGRVALRDRHGSFWSAGVKTLKWYRFDRDAWKEMGLEPIPLEGDDQSEEFARLLVDFAMNGAWTLPEPLTAPWHSPAAVAEPVRTCLECRRTDVGDSAACRFCRAAFPAAGCITCGAPLIPGHSFCNQCGAPKGGARSCPNPACRRPIASGQRFCIACGVKVS